MASFNRIKVGDTLYDVHSERAGNTTMRRVGCWPVYVRELDAEKRQALCSWNGNTPRWYSERQLGKLRRSRPVRKDR